MITLDDIYRWVSDALIKANPKPEPGEGQRLHYSEEHGDFKLTIDAVVATVVSRKVYTFTDISFSINTTVTYSSMGRTTGALVGTIKGFTQPII